MVYQKKDLSNYEQQQNHMASQVCVMGTKLAKGLDTVTTIVIIVMILSLVVMIL